MQQQEDIACVSEEISALNQKLEKVTEELVEEESTLEKEMRSLFGTEVEGSTLYNYYSQVKRVQNERIY
jgi:hypothetical protein